MFSKLILRFAALFLLLAALPAAAAINVFASVPEWAALAREIGGDKVNVFSATNALQDPHRIEARPSLIARARSSQLVVATGAELEIGWLPVVLREVCKTPRPFKVLRVAAGSSSMCFSANSSSERLGCR